MTDLNEGKRLFAAIPETHDDAHARWRWEDWAVSNAGTLIERCEKTEAERDAAIAEVDVLRRVLVEKLCRCCPPFPVTDPLGHQARYPVCPYRATMVSE